MGRKLIFENFVADNILDHPLVPLTTMVKPFEFVILVVGVAIVEARVLNTHCHMQRTVGWRGGIEEQRICPKI